MKSLWFILILLLIAAAGWLAWGYYFTEDRVRAIGSDLPSTESLDAMSLEETEEHLRVAMFACGRLPSLQWNPVARLLRGDEIKALAEHCEMLKARQDAMQGP